MSTPLLVTTGRRIALAVGVPISLALIAWGAVNVIALLSADSFQIHRSVAAAGSQVSLTFKQPLDDTATTLAARTAEVGEPFVSFFTPDGIEAK